MAKKGAGTIESSKYVGFKLSETLDRRIEITVALGYADNKSVLAEMAIARYLDAIDQGLLVLPSEVGAE